MTADAQVRRGSQAGPVADRDLQTGAGLMAIAGVAFVGYGLVFLVWNFVGGGFELGVQTING